MKKISFKHKTKSAFVASGGAVKAACFHVGVCLAMEKKGIKFGGGIIKKSTTQPPSRPSQSTTHPVTINTYVGSSAGASIAAFLAAGFPLTDIVKSFIDPPKTQARKKRRGEVYIPKFRYTDLFRFAKPNFRKYIGSLWRKRPKIASGSVEAFFKNHLSFGGIFTTDGIEQYLRKILPTNRFEDLVADLFIVATQLDYPYKTIFCKQKKIKSRPEHHAVYESSIKISQAAAASTALPPIYQPYPIKIGKEKIYFYDGEIRETLSTHVAKDVGCDLVFASYTHQPYQYTPEIGSLVNYGISSVTIQAIYQAVEQKIHTSKRLWKNKITVLDTVNQFFRDNSFPDNKRAELCEILENKLQINKNIDYIFIHPIPQDYKLFLADHFNLSRKHMIEIVKSGFRSGIYHLRNYEFQ